MIRNVIFDWSGTLVDDLPAVWRTTNHILQQAGLPEMTLDRFRAEFRLPFQEFYTQHLPHVGLPQLERWFHAFFPTVQHTAQPIAHAREFLEFCLERGVRTFLLSTIHRDHYATQSEATGFGRFIQTPYVEVWDKRRKIGEILSEHGLAATETVFIGDMQHDVETAHEGGVFSCAVLTGYNRLDQLRASEPDLIVEHLGEFRALLERNEMRMAGRRSNGAAAAERFPLSTVGALIFNREGQVLMIRTRKWSDRWGIPGGKIQYGETAVAALRREIREETALEIGEVRFVMAQDCVRSPEFYREAHFVLLNYTCRVVGVPAVVLNEEAQEYRWETVPGALAMELNQPTRRLIEAVQAGGEGPVIGGE